MTTQTNPDVPQPTDRDAGGRFKPGNRGGPGNPFARQVAQLRKALLDAVGPDDIQAVAQRLVCLAKEGDVAAAKLLLAYTIGKPEAAPHPDRMDADEWEGYRQTATMKAESAAMVCAGAPALHLEVVRVLRPLISELMRGQVAELATAPPAPEPTDEPRTPAEFDAMVEELRRDCPGLFRQPAPPSPNGPTGEPPPSTNGTIGAPPPSTNGRCRHHADAA
jgi:hypothetical protein